MAAAATPVTSSSGRTESAALLNPLTHAFNGLRRCSCQLVPSKSTCIYNINVNQCPFSSSQLPRPLIRPCCKCKAELNGNLDAPSSSSSCCCGSLNIVFVSAEVAPWSKTGGLGDVLSGLPPALAALGHRVMTVAPRYDQYRDAWDTQVLVDVKAGNQMETIRYFHSYKNGVDRVFVDHPFFLEKVWGQTGSKIYGPEAGEDYLDNEIRYSMFNQAAVEAPLRLNLLCSGKSSSSSKLAPYGEDVVFVVNDWHSALLPLYLKANYIPRGIFQKAKVAMCIHNIAYQGRFASEDFSLLNLPDQFKGSFDFKDGYLRPVKGRKINWMKAGLLESDLVVTVSPNYASELLSDEDKGVELDSIVRTTGITGIVNGMDVQEWDPSTDKYLDVNYDLKMVLKVKPALKEGLQAELGLPVKPDVPIFAFIGRLEEQKGFDILEESIPEILKDDVQLVALGTGKKSLQKKLLEIEMKFPQKARGIAKFSPAVAHMMVAGADYMLVPSRFEPCGLIQLFAMRYGTVPVVASTGGLVDTVKDGETGIHVGKSFNVKCEEVDPNDVQALASAVRRAVKVYQAPSAYNKLVKAAMAQDLSWKEPAKKWEAVLANLAGHQRDVSLSSTTKATAVVGLA